MHLAAATGHSEALRVLLEMTASNGGEGARALDGGAHAYASGPSQDAPPARDVIGAAVAGQVDVLHALVDRVRPSLLRIGGGRRDALL